MLEIMTQKTRQLTLVTVKVGTLLKNERRVEMQNVQDNFDVKRWNTATVAIFLLEIDTLSVC